MIEIPEGSPIPPTSSPSNEFRSLAGKHPEGRRIQYLGISKNTLYRYACQQTIESRKLGGRLEYHRSTLDGFKNRQIRPARRHIESGSIITQALGSGK